jgi:sugar/nucleoside kinase (ribokinase family)
MAATVLIVDDHPGFRAAARRLLELEGYEVVGEAQDGMSAIDAARALRPDFILLDVQLPDVDGFEVAERLCVDPAATTVPASRRPRRAASSPRLSSRPPGSRISWLREARGVGRLTVDVAVLTPTYLDYTFVGLEGLPLAGEERFAGDMLRSPGGGGIVALAAARLGLSVALVAPLGDDLAGRFVRRALEEDGVEVGEPRGPRTPTTVVMPVAGDRAMVTVDPGLRARAADVEPYAPRAVAATLEQIDLLPAGPGSYLTCGDDDARAFAGRLPRSTRKPRALVVTAREGAMLTGESDPAAAVEELAAVADTAVVTLGPEGAVASIDGRSVRVPSAWAEPVVDTTGTEELLATAFAWAELHDAEPEVALRWASLYAGLGVTAHTAAGGAVTRERLLDEGTRLSLPPLPSSATA